MASSEPARVPIPKNGVDYRGTVVLAPMVRSGELPSRLLALKYGADLVWGPETIDRAIIGTTRRLNPRTSTLEFSRLPTSKIQDPTLDPEKRESIIYRIHPELEKGKLIYQMGTANPELAVQAAKIVAGDVAGIDVNSGCPKPFSTAGGMGAALLKTPDLLCDILTSLVEEVGKPYEIGISVKIRILDKPEETEVLVKRLVRTGITGLTVHCRTTPMRPRERAIRDQLKMVAQICKEAGVACVMNGDVTSRTEAIQLMQEFGADGAMIATEAEKNPSCFRPDAAGGPHEWRSHWKTVVTEYMRLALQVENRWGNTKYLLSQMIPGREAMYVAMNKSKCYADVIRALGLEEVDGMLEQAKTVDEHLHLPPPESKADKKKRVKDERKERKVKRKEEVEEQPEAKRIKVQEAAVEDLILPSAEMVAPATVSV
ncbi:FMN-linked oxidoreductase [Dothidotthia symphoricarpi CBS 119687]|uniref:FMN-linked oxidoreductase n=1 Tax=Dothidotthia symphoricarpi CBS 119687 TaxID=1392245 RepID=A0A6A6AP58_9PLEO|nr:FMN-linked oxidoreductase [Dothidotthia symphoricarpi CBS 119687]KAF2132973.1 FMN-linked oxidoreductase [Dothidotthia symphoricarpi CBS 119687]